jgi:predicted ribosome quality control (RQC) complex YloA/Tae2 family protein
MKKVQIQIDENDKTYWLLIGQNQMENGDILMQAHPDDLWFHLEKMSGPHMILQNAGEPVPKRYINAIGGMFRNYKLNMPSRCRVIYTEVRNVKTTDVVGSVIASRTRFIKI